MNLPEHHESPVVFVYLKGSVEMFFSLTEKETLEERNERMSSSWKRWEYSHFSSLWWRNNTTPDYGSSPGVEKRYILVVCDATVGSPDRMVHTGGNLWVRNGATSCDRQQVLHQWRKGLISAFPKLNAFLPRNSRFPKQFTLLLGKQSKTSGVFFFTQSLSATLAASW